MNIENAERTMKMLESPPLNFNYSCWFNVNGYAFTSLREAKEYLSNWKDCGTTACLAGEICYAFGPEDEDAQVFSNKFLDLTEDESFFLFIDRIDGRKIHHAKARLQWLMDGKSILDYDFDGERNEH